MHSVAVLGGAEQLWQRTWYPAVLRMSPGGLTMAAAVLLDTRYPGEQWRLSMLPPVPVADNPMAWRAW